MKKIIVIFLVFSFSTAGYALERKELKQVNLDQLTQETQIIYTDIGVHLVWWMPPEFWEASLAREKGMTRQQVEEVMKILRPYSMLAIVQADVSTFGSFSFYDKKQVTKHLKVVSKKAGGNKRISLVDKVPPDLELLQQQLKPILSAALGNMGQSFHFFVFKEDNNGARVSSPYEEGVLSVTLLDKKGNKIQPFNFETPLNAMYVPRICPNGKEAHVSWKVCPWDGTKLPE